MTEFRDLPEVGRFEGLMMDPEGVVTIQYETAQESDVVCSLRFPVHQAPKLLEFLLQLQASGAMSEPQRSNFPPDRLWRKVEGVLYQPRATLEGSQVSISGRDHRDREVTFWTNLPNALYLMNMLSHAWKSAGQPPVPSEPPAEYTDQGS